ncbi:MAG TPA: DUF930 domain-containing protein [Devosia sp.]|nr:DUF930 domain-containing protein [Devosia sp.]
MAARITDMRLVIRTLDWRLPIGADIAASAVLHVALLALLLHQSTALPDAPPERSIAIDLVTAAQYAVAIAAVPTVLTAPASRTSAVPPTARLPPVPQPKAETSGMVHARQLLGASVLAEPASKEVRETLPLLGSDEQRIQLCNIEALAQIHAADERWDPDILVAYAMADMEVTDHGVAADGGAFRSRQQWYGFKFRCEVSSNLKAVTDFQFAIGEPIPKSEWASHDLTADDQDMD